MRLLSAMAEVYELIGNFPNEEVDDVFCKEFRKRCTTCRERIVQVGFVLGMNLFYAKDTDPQAEEWYNKLVVG